MNVKRVNGTFQDIIIIRVNNYAKHEQQLRSCDNEKMNVEYCMNDQL